MQDPHLDYLETRARRERAIANTSEDNCAALVHLRMADEYERRAQVLKENTQPVRSLPAAP